MHRLGRVVGCGVQVSAGQRGECNATHFAHLALRDNQRPICNCSMACIGCSRRRTELQHVLADLRLVVDRYRRHAWQLQHVGLVRCRRWRADELDGIAHQLRFVVRRILSQLRRIGVVRVDTGQRRLLRQVGILRVDACRCHRVELLELDRVHRLHLRLPNGHIGKRRVVTRRYVGR